MADLAWPDMPDQVLAVPVGSTEQHGPHLPSMVDWRCVQEVSHRAARIMEKTTAVVAAQIGRAHV